MITLVFAPNTRFDRAGNAVLVVKIIAQDNTQSPF